MPDPVLELLHTIDRDASGRIALPEAIANTATRDRSLQSSLIEEAITSSQLEGASTTREHAKAMIRSSRRPRDVSERMILNSYRAMQRMEELKAQPPSPELIYEIRSTVTEGTLPERASPPDLRHPGDRIAVYDDRDGTPLHDPLDARAIPERMAVLCRFANATRTDGFMHPAMRAIVLQLWLAYDHPFIDGHGRTARDRFYWSMLREGCWLVELVSISGILRKAPVAYARSFLYTETDDNDLAYFIDAHLCVLRLAIRALHAYLARKVVALRATEQMLQASVDLDHRQIALLGHALRHPGTRYSIEPQRHRVTYETARTELLDLAGRGLLTKSRSGRAFAFTPARDLAERPSRAPVTRAA
jgi:Fic family protein